MAHILESYRITADLGCFEHFKKIAKMTVAHAEFALGADEAKRFEADVAKCVDGNVDVALKNERLQETYQAMFARINTRLVEQAAVTGRLTKQLQACTGVDACHADAICIESLSECASQKALELALKIVAQNTRELEVTSGNNKMLAHTVHFAQQEKILLLNAVRTLGALTDSTKASLNAATEASVRSESVRRTANEKIAQLEKQASETSERVAQVVRDIQKLVYKKEDPDRPTWTKIQQKPLACLERTAQTLKRASEGKGADGEAPNCADCKALKVTLESLQTENSKLLDDKKSLLEDRQRDKDDMNKLTEQMAKLRTENATEKHKKRNK